MAGRGRLGPVPGVFLGQGKGGRVCTIGFVGGKGEEVEEDSEVEDERPESESVTAWMTSCAAEDRIDVSSGKVG